MQRKKRPTTGTKTNAKAVVTVRHADGTVSQEIPKTYYSIRQTHKPDRTPLSPEEQRERSLKRAENANANATKSIIKDGREWWASLTWTQQQEYIANKVLAKNNLRKTQSRNGVGEASNSPD